ncbi:MAG: PQQ-binding-like beta-propeller repeat protein [Bryobacteraceae bacterium]
MRVFLFVLASLALAADHDWPTFHGINSSGVAPDTGLPVEFGPDKNLVWKTELPAGHSSPVLVGNRIYLTGYDKEGLYTFALDRATGRILWRRQAPRPRVEKLHNSNSPASPSAASDGKNVFVFFTDFGVLSYGPDGNERWRMALGPFNNPMGQGATPVLAGKTLLVPCDQEAGSFFVALDKDTGKVKWRVERPDFTRGFSTPILYKPKDGPLQALLAGSYKLVAYEVETGKEAWWVGGLTWQLKPTPVMDEEKIYVLGWAGEADPGQQEVIPEFREALDKFDADKDGKLQKSELAADKKLEKSFGDLDLDGDGALGPRDWKMYQAKRQVVNGVNAFKLGGKGDMTGKSEVWKYEKSLPNVPSPLLYQGVVYLCKDGGILTALDAKTGKVLKQGRITGAPGNYFTSPVAADGKIFTISEEGKVAVIKPGAEWEVIRINDLNTPTHATPAIADNGLYIRTDDALYRFAAK